MWTESQTGREIQRRERETEREIHRQTHTETHRETERDAETGRGRGTENHGQTEIKTQPERNTDTETETIVESHPGTQTETVAETASDREGRQRYAETDTDRRTNRGRYMQTQHRNNGRVLMMTPDLESSKVLLTPKDKLGRPSRICLDEESSCMFVADNKAENPRIMVFRLTKHKTGTFGGLFKTLEAGDRHVEGTTPLIEVQEINVKDDANPVGENFAEEAIPLLEVTGTTEEKPIIIPDDEQDTDASTSPEEEYPDGTGDNLEVIQDTSDNEEEEGEFQDAKDKLEESQGGKVEVISGNISGNEEGEKALLGEKDPLEERQDIPSEKAGSVTKRSYSFKETGYRFFEFLQYLNSVAHEN